MKSCLRPFATTTPDLKVGRYKRRGQVHSCYS
ncbi:hypothetical protein VDGL01_11504 [Verticillium dahliae]